MTSFLSDKGTGWDPCQSLSALFINWLDKALFNSARHSLYPVKTQLVNIPSLWYFTLLKEYLVLESRYMYKSYYCISK